MKENIHGIWIQKDTQQESKDSEEEKDAAEVVEDKAEREEVEVEGEEEGQPGEAVAGRAVEFVLGQKPSWCDHS